MNGDDQIGFAKTMLRDWFAGQALAGYLASFAGMDDTSDATHAAAQAYRYADAMLKAREKQP